MAIRSGYRLSDLSEWCRDLELEPVASGKNGRFMGEDYIKVLREYFLNERYGDNIPIHMNMALKRKSPMLAQRIDKYDDEFQRFVENDDSYIYEEKLNGMRAMIIKDETGLHIYSRHSSAEDLLPVDLTDNIKSIVYFNSNFISRLNELHSNFQIDSELDISDEDVDKMKLAGILDDSATKLQAITSIMNSLPERAIEIQENLEIKLRFNIFDCVVYKGKNIDKLELHRRKKGLSIIKDILNSIYDLNLIDVKTAYTKVEKETLLKEMILSGREGIVAKDINSSYRSDGNRDETWVKIKPSVSFRDRIIREHNKIDDEDLDEDMFNGDLGLNLNDIIPDNRKFGDTIDAFITGFQDGRGNFTGLVGSVELSTWIVKDNGDRYLHPIAWISGFDKSMREDMTILKDGKIALNPKYYNQVWEIDGQGISHQNLRLNHARLIQVRTDKNPNQCETPEDILKYVL